jgi:REP element-mobilizing transposase RayT
MANTYSQIYIQFVLVVKNRDSLIHTSWEEELYKYISGIVTNKGQKLIAVNGMPDHLHLCVGLKPDCRPSDLIREVKKASNDFIKEKRFTKFPFYWQEGFGAFSYGNRDITMIYNYVMNQKEHHKKKKFKDEYMELLKEFEIEFKEEYLFDFLEV